MFYELEGNQYVLDTSGDEPHPRLFRCAGETKNLRTMAVHDGPVFLHEDVLYMEYEDGIYVAYHHWAGQQFMATIEENFGLGTAVLLDEVMGRV